MKMSTTGDSPYLAKENVPVPVVATIASVTFEAITFRNITEDKWVMHFASPKLKPMLLNKGNRKTLIAAYGDDTDNYPGKKIEVWVNPNVEFEGEVVGGLRLRLPSQNGSVSMTFAQAVTDCAAVGISSDELKAHLKDRGIVKVSDPRFVGTVQALIASGAESQGFDDLPPPPDNQDEIQF